MCSFAERLKLARLNKKLTQKQLGEAIGLNETTYQNYELEYSEPNLTHLLLISDILQVSINDLLDMNQNKIASNIIFTTPTFPQRLKECRNYKRLTQKEAAEQLGIKWRRYQTYETGESEPSLAVLTSLAKFYEVSVDALIGHNSHMRNDIK